MTHARVQSLTQYSHFLMNIFIPIFVTLSNRTIFFALVTPIILWRFYHAIVNRKVYNISENILRISDKTIWIIYHFSFIILYVLEKLKLKTTPTSEAVIKYLGFIIIFCVLLGAIVDIIDVLYNIFHLIIKGLKIVFKKVEHFFQISRKIDDNKSHNEIGK